MVIAEEKVFTVQLRGYSDGITSFLANIGVHQSRYMLFSNNSSLPSYILFNYIASYKNNVLPWLLPSRFFLSFKKWLLRNCVQNF